MADLSVYDPEQQRLMSEECIVVDQKDNAVGHASKKDCHLQTSTQKGILHRAFSVFLFNPEGQLLLQKRSKSKITFPVQWANTCCSHPLFIGDESAAPSAAVQGCTLSSLLKRCSGVKRAAQQRLLYELGIAEEQVPLEDIHFLTRIHYAAASDETWCEHEVDYILFFQGHVDLHVNENEVAETRYVTRDTLRDMMLLDTRATALGGGHGSDDVNAADGSGGAQSGAVASESSDKAPSSSSCGSVVLTPWFRLICDTRLFSWWDAFDELRLNQVCEPDVTHFLCPRDECRSESHSL